MECQSSDLTCPICLDCFQVPVAINCGHTFCQKCITAYWDTTSNIGPCCPTCNHKFDIRPILKCNVALSSIAEAVNSTRTSYGDGGSEDVESVPCDRHKKPLVYYCTRDKISVCCECAISQCESHHKVLLEVESKRQKLLLEKKNEEMAKLIEETEESINNLTENMDKAKETFQQTSSRVTAKFSTLLKVLVDRQEAIELFIEKQKEASISEAQARLSELEESAQKLRAGQAHIVYIHNRSDIELIKESTLIEVPCLKKTSTDITPILQDRISGIMEVLTRVSKLVIEDLDRAVCTAVGHDKDGSPQEKRPILAVGPSPAAACRPGGKEGLSAHRCSLTFDPHTANGNLLLSQENRKAEHLTSSTSTSTVFDHESRFDHAWQVLCIQGFRHGQHYWEMEVSKPWAYLGVTYITIPRKEKGKRCMLGMNDLSWSLQLDEEKLSAWHNGRKETLAGRSKHSRVGMLLDCEAGTLTFYGDGHVRLHAFHCTFTQELFPACWIGEGVSITLCST
ncbi:E3 ubiquitin-protein ligase TRIM65 [Entelurus aequoreus]|uniref:E3 ubiquitin-protein ligase TRIM65 n=1 Tax=Entelurus aequoreus TaxID=161455 RepID=UPI002B1DB04C|nr:E3 ubiquitin-protein ligase TRIM65 [Entelurus aequoreus]XP_061912267.1 E3 ubiquitin-protein ligase TRIM65 [Entelurus aequoreus]XP_061912268.1 E3 ubiquitin-protein ligase TRIM65 [Entelurus aequoreus]